MSGVGQLVMNGPLILAVPVAAAAGAITFASPCCLPLIPRLPVLRGRHVRRRRGAL